MVLIVLLGGIAAEFTCRWVVFATLLFISGVRSANCVYRMFRYYVAEDNSILDMPQSIALIDSISIGDPVTAAEPTSPLSIAEADIQMLPLISRLSRASSRKVITV